MQVSYREKGVQLWVEQQGVATPNWTVAGAGYPKGTGPYHVSARLFAESVLQRLNVVRSSTILAGLADDNEA